MNGFLCQSWFVSWPRLDRLQPPRPSQRKRVQIINGWFIHDYATKMSYLWDGFLFSFFYQSGTYHFYSNTTQKISFKNALLHFWRHLKGIHPWFKSAQWLHLQRKLRNFYQGWSECIYQVFLFVGVFWNSRQKGNDDKGSSCPPRTSFVLVPCLEDKLECIPLCPVRTSVTAACTATWRQHDWQCE